MKEKYLINARIIDPKNNLDEIGGVTSVVSMPNTSPVIDMSLWLIF